MGTNPFDKRIAAAQRRVETLAQQIDEVSPECQAQVENVVRQVRSILQEMAVHDEQTDRSGQPSFQEQDVSMALLQTILDSTSAQLAYLDPSFRFVYVNSAYARSAGYDQRELVGRYHFDLFPDKENQTIFQQVRDSGQPVSFQARPFVYAYTPQRGTTFWDWSLAPIKDAGGKVQGLVLSLSEVTDRILVEQEMASLAAQHAEARYRAERQAEELQQTMEELRVAEKELEAQNQELVQNRQLLELERQRYQDLFDFAPGGYLVTDLSGVIQEANQAAAHLLGIDPQFLRGKPLSLYLEPAKHAILYARIQKIETGQVQGPIQWETRIRPRRGSAFDAVLTVDADRSIGSDKNPAALRWLVRDITERVRSEEMLRRYTQHLQLLHRLDQAILAARSAEGITQSVLPPIRLMLDARRASVLMFDWPAEEAWLLGMDASGPTRLAAGQRMPLKEFLFLETLQEGKSIIIEDLRSAEVSPPLLEQLITEGMLSLIVIPLTAQGELIGSFNLAMATPGRLSADQMDIAVQLANGLAIGIQQAHLHAEIQRRAQDLEQSVARRTAALQASEARFRTIFEDSALGIALLDMEGRILASNPALQQLLGFDAKELHDKNFDDLTHPDDIAVGQGLYDELITGVRDHYQLEKRYVRKDGSIVWVRPTVSLVRKTRQGPQYAIKMIEDISEQKRTQEALIQAEKLSIAGQLGASLAHEINNPLQSVIGCLGLAEEVLVEGGDVSRYLRIAHEELRRTARIVAQLRDLHRHAGPEEAEPIELNALLQEVLFLIRKQLESHEVDVYWDKVEGLPHLLLVPDRIRQVFLNVLLNAVDAMPQGGELRIETIETHEPPGIQIAFTDTGVGMAPAELERLFQPFHSTKPEGLGLGLFISHRIIREHQGHIEATSRLGEGTTVNIWLPARDRA